MKKMRRVTLPALLSAISWGVAAAATVTPGPAGGVISGNPGDTVGWGFNFNNDTDYAVLSFSDFAPASPWGSYSDFIVLNFVVVAPQSNYTAAFDGNAGLGTGGFSILASTPLGTQIDAAITLFYDLYTADPSDPNAGAQIVSLSNSTVMNVTVAVGPTAAAAGAPEPATIGMALGGVVLIALGSFSPRRLGHR
jgi:hypothetical protein